MTRSTFLARRRRRNRPAVLARHWLPRGLYGRALLILILPVITLQLVVSIVFIQRHFEDVTRQMTGNVLQETQFVIDMINQQETLPGAQAIAATLGPPLALDLSLPVATPNATSVAFYDVSGRVMASTLRRALPGLEGVDVQTDPREVALWIDTDFGGLRIGLPRSRMTASNPHQLLVWMIFTGILMTLISIVFLRSQLRPIRRLARAAEAFGKGRHMPYHPGGPSEVRSAGIAFVDMRERIERQIEQRTLILSGVSHDLRTPLTRLRLALSMADPNDETDAMQRDVADMERLVDEFLDFARGDALDDVTPIDLTDLVRGIVEDASRSGHAVTLTHADETGIVDLRPMAVTRALDNLIGNAGRHAAQTQLRLDLGNQVIRIAVDDDGPGIPANKREEAMRPFTRLDPARNQNTRSGVGLGLAVAADIARKHGGHLVLDDSVALGGLRATIILAR